MNRKYLFIFPTIVGIIAFIVSVGEDGIAGALGKSVWYFLVFTAGMGIYDLLHKKKKEENKNK